MNDRAGGAQPRHDRLGVLFAEIDAGRRHDNHDRAQRLPLGEPARRVVQRVHEIGCRIGTTEELRHARLQPVETGCRLDQDLARTAKGDHGDLVALVQLLDKALERATEVPYDRPRRHAGVDQNIDLHRRRRGAGAKHLSIDAIFSDEEIAVAETLKRGAGVVENTDVQLTFPRQGLRVRRPKRRPRHHAGQQDHTQQTPPHRTRTHTPRWSTQPGWQWSDEHRFKL